MLLNGLLTPLREDTRFQDALLRLKSPRVQVGLNVVRAARSYTLAALAQEWRGPIIYLSARGKRAHNVVEQLPVWLGATHPLLPFAEPTPMFYDRLPWDRSVIHSRLGALSALMPAQERPDQKIQPIVITSARALMQRTLSPAQFHRYTQHLSVGSQHNLDTLIQSWVDIGYEPASMVTETGTFTRRGGIVDIYPIASRLPVRIEFFGDEIDTLRQFDPSTQRTVQQVQSVEVYPARELLPHLTPPAARHLADWFQQSGSVNDDEQRVSQDAEALANGQPFPYLEHYLPYVLNQPISLLDYTTDDCLIVVDDLMEFREVMAELEDTARNNRENNIRTGQLAEDHPQPYIERAAVDADLSARRVLILDNLTEEVQGRIFAPAPRFGGQLRSALGATHVSSRQGGRVVVISQQIDRLNDIWAQEAAEQSLPRTDTITELPTPGSIRFVPGSLSEGFIIRSEASTIEILSDAELFNWSRPEPRRRKNEQQGRRVLPEQHYADWSTGDHVVHVDYGIGRFMGLRSRVVEGNEREYLFVEYDGTDSLFVPIDQADRLTRYVGPDEVPPTLNKLGKPELWLRTREKAKKAAEEEARELLDIYARRANASGHVFHPDTAWQHELEASFPYVETEDQLRTLREVKADMESRMPMDRLVCGDVGYGKTEVALRAAFKAVTDHKQVAILVPTTVLANQHYETFNRRMGEFPIKVEMISRFRTKAEQRHVLDQLARGEIDIIIGTHRLLSDDVTFHDLGLVIIDEEQRFGVKHKEHFKKLRSQVDILTLTATPIPRTLYMGLAGVRDISMIQTPPEERLPVITHAGSFDGRLARQAILRELDRGGQIFIIHNRVRTIEAVRERFEALVPEASIIIAHGQMSGRQLEQVISEFSQGRYDILLATSIIENGIDMPNVNTLIVDRADWFGMSQLYQIRGRVGRGSQQGYAYFFHGGSGKLTEEARSRLETLAEHTDLGVGFQIAVRDLELRGAGDILSTRQTGHVASVGLQLYSQLLQAAVSRLKDEDEPEHLPTYARERVILDLPLAAYIPHSWIGDMSLRLQLYRRIGSLQDHESVEAMRAELRDRFGPLPPAVEGLLYQIRVKLLASAIHATAVIKPRQHILIKLPWLAAVDRQSLQVRLGEDVEVSRTAVELAIQPEWQSRLVEILEILHEGLPEQVGV